MRFSPITEKRSFATASARSLRGCSATDRKYSQRAAAPHARRDAAERAGDGISIWLRAELPVLMRRVMKRDTRPLLRDGNPEATMRKLIEARYPVMLRPT